MLQQLTIGLANADSYRTDSSARSLLESRVGAVSSGQVILCKGYSETVLPAVGISPRRRHSRGETQDSTAVAAISKVWDKRSSNRKRFSLAAPRHALPNRAPRNLMLTSMQRAQTHYKVFAIMGGDT